ncbi:MAG: type III pantothenate kinase [Spirochaetia bacterium]
MLCAVDVGNSNIVIGLYHGNEWRARWRLATVADRTADEYWLLIRSLFREQGIEEGMLKRTVLSSVVPELNATMTLVLQRFSGEAPLYVSAQLNTGLQFSTGNPREMGADLLANAAAAYGIYKSSSIVIDFGTALTFVAVDEGGVVRGVSIAPGLKTAMEALSMNTAQLPHIPLEVPRAYIGTDTVAAIQSGLMYGYMGLVERMVTGMQAELNTKARVIATGGMAGTLALRIDCIDEQAPWLTLEGLRLLSDLN